jgi:uncharacterized membrane protein (UPF0136 family)
MSGRGARIKPGRASLIGGIAVGVASFALWAAILREVGSATGAWLVLGALISICIAAWIRLADL